MTKTPFELWAEGGALSTESAVTTVALSNESAGEQIAAAMGIAPVRAKAIISAVDAGLRQIGAVSSSGTLSTESLAAVSQTEGAWNWVKQRDLNSISQSDVMTMLKNAGVPKHKMVPLTREVGQILSSNTLRNDAISSEHAAFSNTSGTEAVSLSQLTGTRAYRFFNGAMSNESFGNSINTVQADTRLSVLVTVLQAFTSTIDRLFFRVTNESNLVTVKIESAVTFDLAEVDSAPTAANPTRNNSSLYTPIIGLHANPDKVNSAPQKVMDNLNPDNDTGATKVLDETSLPGRYALAANSVELNLFALVRDEARVGYQSSNHTDMIAEGGKVGSVVLSATGPDGTVETFEAVTLWRPDAAYIPMPNNDDSGDSMASLARVPLVIAPTTSQSTGAASVLFAGLNTASIQLLFGLNSRLSLKYGTGNTAGSVSASVIPAAGYNVTSAAADIETWTTNLSKYKFAVKSYVPALEFNEENLRKTTLGVRTNTLQKQFEIPQSRFVTSDIACDQEREVESIKAMQTVLSIGNSDRSMKIIQSRLQDMAAFVKAAAENPSIYSQINPTSLSFAATRCRPYALDYTLDFEDPNNLVSNMRETEKLSDKHAKVKQILLNTLSNITAESLLLVNYAAGETPVFKILAHSVDADLLLGVPEYHEILANQERVGTANGSDYSFYLDNGFRVDIIKTYFEDWRGLMAVVPVREQDPTDIVSFATNQTRGAFAGTIPGVSINGATAYRAVATDRVISMVTNPTGALIRLKNVDFDIGNLGVVPTAG